MQIIYEAGHVIGLNGVNENGNHFLQEIDSAGKYSERTVEPSHLGMVLLNMLLKNKINGLKIQNINGKVWRGGTPQQAVAFALGSDGSFQTKPPVDKFEKNDVQVTFDKGQTCPVW